MKITLRAARINSELTIKKVSDEVGVSEEVLRNYERGRTEIPARVLNRLVEIYEVTVDDIRLPEKN